MPRRKQFEPEAALQRAMELFWEKGYESTSIQDLLDGLGINRFSLYATFTGKRELFGSALDRYLEEQVAPQVREMWEGREGFGAIRRYFEALLARATGPAGWWGCLMVNTAVEMAPRDRGAARQVKAFMETMEEAFYRALVRARKAGEVQSVMPARLLAQFLTGTVLSLQVLARTRAPLRELKRQVELALSVLARGDPFPGPAGSSPPTGQPW